MKVPKHLQITKPEWQELHALCEYRSDYEIVQEVLVEVSADQTSDMRVCTQIVCCSTRVEQLFGLDWVG